MLLIVRDPISLDIFYVGYETPNPDVSLSNMSVFSLRNTVYFGNAIGSPTFYLSFSENQIIRVSKSGSTLEATSSTELVEYLVSFGFGVIVSSSGGGGGGPDNTSQLPLTSEDEGLPLPSSMQELNQSNTIKIQQLRDSVNALKTAGLEVEKLGSLDLTINEIMLDFVEVQPSTNLAVLEFNPTENSLIFKEPGQYLIFISLYLENDDNNTRTVTIVTRTTAGDLVREEEVPVPKAQGSKKGVFKDTPTIVKNVTSQETLQIFIKADLDGEVVLKEFSLSIAKFASSGGGGGTVFHNSLTDLQGGQPGGFAEYYHLTANQLVDVLKVKTKVGLQNHSFEELRDTANPVISNSLVVMTQDNLVGYAPLNSQVVIPSYSTTNDIEQEILQGTSAQVQFQTQVGSDSSLFDLSGNGIRVVSAQITNVNVSVQLILSIAELDSGDSLSGTLKIFKNGITEVGSVPIESQNVSNKFLILKNFNVPVATNDVLTCTIQANSSSSSNAKYLVEDDIYNLFTLHTSDVSTTLLIPQEYIPLPVKAGSENIYTSIPAGAEDLHIGKNDVVKVYGDGGVSIQGSRLFVAANGNVGIGVTNPSMSLVVQSGGIFLPTTGTNNGITFGVSQTSRLYANGGNSIRIDTGNGNSYINVTNNGLGIQRNPSYRIDVNGPSRFSGNVGVNTAPTSEALEIVGNIKLSGAIITTPALQVGDGATSTGTNTTAVGSLAAASNDSSSALGRRATASNNFATALGYLTVASGVNSTAVGQSTSATAGRSTAIGYNANVAEVNTMVLGDSNTTVKLSNGDAVTSDERDKINITDNDLGLNFIKQIKTRKWRGNNRDQYWIKEEDENGGEVFKTDEKGERVYDAEEHAKGSKAGKRWHRGIVAQEMLNLIDSTEFSGVKDTAVNNPNINHQEMGFAYDQLIAPMIKAIQEQQTQIEQLLQEVENLKNK